MDECIEHSGFLVYPKLGIIKNAKGKLVCSKNKTSGYINFSKDNKTYGVHRFIYEAVHNIQLESKQHINHINRIKDDNRIDNLEICSNQQNAQWSVQRTGNYKGVAWNKEKNKFRAELKYDGKNYCLGYHSTEVDGAKAYNSFAKYMNETKNCKYMLNNINEPDYVVVAKNIPEENAKINQDKKASPYFGVTFDSRRNKYSAQIKYQGKDRYMGTSASDLECAKWVNQQAAWYNEHAGCSYKLNDIENFVTVPKDIVGSIQQAKQDKKSSSYIGVGFSKQKNKWRSTIVFEKKQINLGFFEDEIEAARAYNTKAIELNAQIGKQSYKINVLPN